MKINDYWLDFDWVLLVHGHLIILRSIMFNTLFDIERDASRWRSDIEPYMTPVVLPVTHWYFFSSTWACDSTGFSKLVFSPLLCCYCCSSFLSTFSYLIINLVPPLHCNIAYPLASLSNSFSLCTFQERLRCPWGMRLFNAFNSFRVQNTRFLLLGHLIAKHLSPPFHMRRSQPE